MKKTLMQRLIRAYQLKNVLEEVFPQLILMPQEELIPYLKELEKLSKLEQEKHLRAQSDLIKWLQNHNSHSLGKLFEAFKKDAQSSVLKLDTYRHFDDAYQNLYEKTWNRRNKNRNFPTDSFHFKSWLKKCIKNACIDNYKNRKRRRDAANSLELAIIEIDAKDVKAEELQFEDFLNELMKHLTNREKTVLNLKLDGFSVPEISKELSLGETTIRKEIYKIRAKRTKLIKLENKKSLLSMSTSKMSENSTHKLLTKSNKPFFNWLISNTISNKKIGLILILLFGSIGLLGMVLSPVFEDRLNLEGAIWIQFWALFTIWLWFSKGKNFFFKVDNLVPNKALLKLDYLREYLALKQFTQTINIMLFGFLGLYLFFGVQKKIHFGLLEAFEIPIIHLFNNISSACIVLCFLTLSSITVRFKDESEVKKMRIINRLVLQPMSQIKRDEIEVKKLWLSKDTLFMSLCIVLAFILEAAYPEVLRNHLGLLSGLFGSISIALLTSKLMEPLLSVPKFFIICLFGYVAIQVFFDFSILDFMLDESSYSKEVIGTMFIYFALFNKVILFLIIYWLINTNQLIYYFYHKYHMNDIIINSRYYSSKMI